MSSLSAISSACLPTFTATYHLALVVLRVVFRAPPRPAHTTCYHVLPTHYGARFAARTSATVLVCPTSCQPRGQPVARLQHIGACLSPPDGWRRCCTFPVDGLWQAGGRAEGGISAKYLPFPPRWLRGCAALHCWHTTLLPRRTRHRRAAARNRPAITADGRQHYLEPFKRAALPLPAVLLSLRAVHRLRAWFRRWFGSSTRRTILLRCLSPHPCPTSPAPYTYIPHTYPGDTTYFPPLPPTCHYSVYGLLWFRCAAAAWTGWLPPAPCLHATTTNTRGGFGPIYICTPPCTCLLWTEDVTTRVLLWKPPPPPWPVTYNA